MSSLPADNLFNAADTARPSDQHPRNATVTAPINSAIDTVPSSS